MKLWFLALISIMTLTSCATYHTPLSRSVMEDHGFESSEYSPSNIPRRYNSNDSSEMAAARFDWPVDAARLTRGYLPGKRRPHLGLDLASNRGTPILASVAGTVIYTGGEFRGYGKMILIESESGWATLYAHLDKILVQEGQKVNQGQLLGAMGRTGRASGVHLHFEIRKDKGPVDPLPLLPNGAHYAALIKNKSNN